MNAYFVLIGISLLVILSYFYNVVAKQIRVPSVLLLIITGVLVKLGIDSLNNVEGIQLNLSQVTDSNVITFLGQAGIILIVLEGALDLYLKREKRGLIVSSALAALFILIISSVAIALIIQYLHSVTFLKGLMYAIPLSVMSSAIIIPSVTNLTEKKREFMVYESTLSDILGIMFFNFLNLGEESAGAGGMAWSITSNLLVTILISVVFAYLLVFVFNRINTNIKIFLIISILTLLYSLGKLLHYSSLLIIFLFGLILNNIPVFFSGRLGMLMNIKQRDAQPIIKDFKTLTAETAFLVRTIFFVVFGMTIDTSVLADADVWIIGTLIVVVLYVVRAINLAVIRRTSIFPELWLSPRGLVTILLYYMIPEEYRIPEFGEGIMFFVILVTSIIMTGGLIFSPGKTDEYEDLELGANPSAEFEIIRQAKQGSLFEEEAELKADEDLARERIREEDHAPGKEAIEEAGEDPPGKEA